MQNEWIDVRERKPTKKDADFAGCVVFWHVYNGVTVTGYHQAGNNRFLTHWQKPPKPPKDRYQLIEDAEAPYKHYVETEEKT